MMPNGAVLGIMTALFLALGYLGVPVAFALMAGVIVGTTLTPITLQSMMGQLFNGIDSEALMAIPFFLLVGELMTSANVVVRIAELSQALVGHVRGGLAQVTTVFSMFFLRHVRARPRLTSRCSAGPWRSPWRGRATRRPSSRR